MTIDWILSQYDRRKRVVTEKYRRYVMEEIDKESPWETLKGQIFLGTDEFIKQLSGILDGKGEIKEVPRVQRYVASPSLSELFKEEGEKVKDKTIYNAYVRYGYTMKEIPDHLGIHYATISRAIKRVECG